MKLNSKDIKGLDKKWRLNLINSISGVKPANLIGSRSSKNINNLAIFSSIVHLGSNPAQLGFLMRPQSEKISDTFQNIKTTKFYTINAITKSFYKKAHYTSAKLDSNQSEFEKFKIDYEFIDNFYAPFVTNSPIKIGMDLLEYITLPNKCIFIIGNINILIFPDESINQRGQLNLDTNSIIGISGLNTYYDLKKIKTLPYVGSEHIPNL